jgi:hypothetical protein
MRQHSLCRPPLLPEPIGLSSGVEHLIVHHAAAHRVCAVLLGVLLGLSGACGARGRNPTACTTPACPMVETLAPGSLLLTVGRGVGNSLLALYKFRKHLSPRKGFLPLDKTLNDLLQRDIRRLRRHDLSAIRAILAAQFLHVGLQAAGAKCVAARKEQRGLMHLACHKLVADGTRVRADMPF